jgi:Flp pilus assembly protein TadG
VKHLKHKHNEKGTTIAEFAMVALLFFTMIFGIIEFGRLLYTHNALTDATRRGARYASLHHGLTDADKQAVRNFVVYGPNGTFDDDGNPTSPPLINDLTTDMVEVSFEGVDLDGDPATPETTGFGTNLGQATVSIENYQFNLSIPVVGRTLTLPEYTTTTMAECAGEEPDDIVVPPPAP